MLAIHPMYVFLSYPFVSRENSKPVQDLQIYFRANLTYNRIFYFQQSYAVLCTKFDTLYNSIAITAVSVHCTILRCELETDQLVCNSHLKKVPIKCTETAVMALKL